MPPPSGPQHRPRTLLRALVGLGALALAGVRALLGRRQPPPAGRTRPLFPRWSNHVVPAALGGAALAVVFAFGALLWGAVDASREAPVAPLQPVPFSHQIHAGALEIDCRYCHASAERAAPAGMPSTRTCVPCHNEVWLESEPFAPVRRSLQEDVPIPWLRVHDLPDFTYFHHGAHTDAGVGCETCHGRVDRMTVLQQVQPLSMGWCLDCHRRPEPYLRPRSEITTMGWAPRRPQEEVGPELKLEYEVAEMTHCTVCHR